MARAFFVCGFLVAFAFLVSCADVTQAGDDPLGERPLTVDALVGGWSDSTKIDYVGGGDVQWVRHFEFRPDGTFTMAIHTVDSPTSGRVETYRGYRGTFEITGDTITCRAHQSRTKASAFQTAEEGWVDVTPDSKILSTQAMLYNRALFWNPHALVWTKAATNDPGLVLALETTVRDFEDAQDQRHTWSFYDTSKSSYVIVQEQTAFAFITKERIVDGAIVTYNGFNVISRRPLLEVNGRYFVGSEGISNRVNP